MTNVSARLVEAVKKVFSRRPGIGRAEEPPVSSAPGEPSAEQSCSYYNDHSGLLFLSLTDGPVGDMFGATEDS